MESPEKKNMVFFMPETYPSLAGTGLNALHFARQLSAEGFDVTICSLNYRNRLAKSEQVRGISVRRLPYDNRNVFTKAISLVSLLFRYSRWIKQNNYIFIYSAYLIGFQFIILRAAWTGRKVIFRSSLLGGDDATSLLEKSRLVSKLNAYCLKHISLYYSINEAFTESWKCSFGDQIPMFESIQGVDLSQFQPVSSQEAKLELRRKLGIRACDLVIISAGFLLKKKGFHEIFTNLKKLNIDFNYYILGDCQPTHYHHLSKQEKGEMLELKSSGRNLLGGKIIFTGPVNNMEEYFQATDIFLHGSYMEGTPNAVLEAMACGVPCVVKKLQGLSGVLIDRENALVFEDFTEIPDKISLLVKDRSLAECIGNGARKTILTQADLVDVAHKMKKQL